MPDIQQWIFGHCCFFCCSKAKIIYGFKVLALIRLLTEKFCSLIRRF